MATEKKYEFTDHALLMIADREILVEWIERVFNNPEKIEPDPNDSTLSHALGSILEFGGRVLRIIYDDKTKPKRIVTVYFDRKMKEKL